MNIIISTATPYNEPQSFGGSQNGIGYSMTSVCKIGGEEAIWLARLHIACGWTNDVQFDNKL